MSEYNFQVGRVLPASSPVYIIRKADQDAALHLDRMEYISIIEPRQHGKTSLIAQLINKFKPFGYMFALVDMSTVKSQEISAKEWYAALGRRLLPQLSTLIPTEGFVLESSISWDRFLFDIAERAETAGRRVVIVLDEIGRVPQPLATDFFTVIRSVCTHRHNLSYLEHLTFVIAGAFNPKELIQDTAVSEFNVDQRIHLEDFNPSEVRQLVTYLHLPDDQTEAVTEQVYYWTEGQPYLSQKLYQFLAGQRGLAQNSNINALVEEGVKKFLNHDPHYLERFNRLSARPELLAYAQSIADGNRPLFRSVLDNRHFWLAHVLGIIKAGQDGRCQLRNRICMQALAEMRESTDGERSVSTQPLDVFSSASSLPSTQPLKTPFQTSVPVSTHPLEAFLYDVFISYSHKDKHFVYGTLLPRLEKEGVRMCVDERNFDIGASLPRNIEKAIEQSRKILLSLTPNWLESEWGNFEHFLTHIQDPMNKNQRLVPILVEPCTLPNLLRGFYCLDLTKPTDFERQMQRLVADLKPQLQG